MGLYRRPVDPRTRSRVGESGRGSPCDFYVITASKGRHEANGQLAFSALRDRLAPEGEIWLSSYLLAACMKNVSHILTGDSLTYFSSIRKYYMVVLCTVLKKTVVLQGLATKPSFIMDLFGSLLC